MIISLIAAMTPERVIGCNNLLPWHMPADLQHFKKLTSGKTVVMGRKTFQSIGRPLPNRRNIIITRDKNFSATGCEIFHSIDDALAVLKDESEVCIIGGQEIFSQTLAHADFLHLTFIHASIDGDTYFPEWNGNEWKEISREKHLADEKNIYNYDFFTLEKITAQSLR